MTGPFISFEGGEGAGKSTQIQKLSTFLQEYGKDVLITREPGGSDGAEKIRELMVTGDVARWDGVCEAMLVFAGRRDHYNRVIAPALERGTYVLCDRFADSSYAYQGYGHGVDLTTIEQLYTMACGDFRPHLTFVIDVPTEIGLIRAQRRGGAEQRYENMDIDFHKRVRQGFLTLANNAPERYEVMDGTQPINTITTEIQRIVMERFL